MTLTASWLSLKCGAAQRNPRVRIPAPELCLLLNEGTMDVKRGRLSFSLPPRPFLLPPLPSPAKSSFWPKQETSAALWCRGCWETLQPVELSADYVEGCGRRRSTGHPSVQYELGKSNRHLYTQGHTHASQSNNRSAIRAVQTPHLLSRVLLCPLPGIPEEDGLVVFKL